MVHFPKRTILALLIASSVVGLKQAAWSADTVPSTKSFVLKSDLDPSASDATGQSIPAKIHPDLTHIPVIAEGRGCETPQGPVCGRYKEDGCVRSGYPTTTGRYAAPSVDAKHSVGYVGGGAHAVQGEARRSDEGTFGYDYSGLWFSRRVWMLWSHGDRHQGGAGAYKTDGPRIIPE